jgi:hypothetical protein
MSDRLAAFRCAALSAMNERERIRQGSTALRSGSLQEIAFRVRERGALTRRGFIAYSWFSTSLSMGSIMVSSMERVKTLIAMPSRSVCDKVIAT